MKNLLLILVIVLCSCAGRGSKTLQQTNTEEENMTVEIMDLFQDSIVIPFPFEFDLASASIKESLKGKLDDPELQELVQQIDKLKAYSPAIVKKTAKAEYTFEKVEDGIKIKTRSSNPTSTKVTHSQKKSALRQEEKKDKGNGFKIGAIGFIVGLLALPVFLIFFFLFKRRRQESELL